MDLVNPCQFIGYFPLLSFEVLLYFLQLKLLVICHITWLLVKICCLLWCFQFLHFRWWYTWIRANKTVFEWSFSGRGYDVPYLYRFSEEKPSSKFFSFMIRLSTSIIAHIYILGHLLYFHYVCLKIHLTILYVNSSLFCKSKKLSNFSTVDIWNKYFNSNACVALLKYF